MRLKFLVFAVNLIFFSRLSAGTVEGWLPVFPPPVTLQNVERYPTNSKPAMLDTFYKPPATVVYLVSVTEQELPKQEPVAIRPKVVQINRRFIPEVLPVVGTTVDFPNFDPFFHNAFSYSKTNNLTSAVIPRESPGPSRLINRGRCGSSVKSTPI